jgi:hypothetical protein
MVFVPAAIEMCDVTTRAGEAQPMRAAAMAMTARTAMG